MWEDSIFIFDTSALLDLYFYSDSSQNEFFKLLKELKNRLWIPHQVFEEYERHREVKILAPKTGYDNLLKESSHNKDKGYLHKIENHFKSIDGVLNTLNEETKKQDKHPHIDNTIVSKYIDKVTTYKKDFESFHGGVVKEIEKQKSIIDKKVSEDKILKYINKNFDIGPEHSYDELVEIAKEGEIRYRLELPPGYMDAVGRDAKSGINKYGDLFLWKQILDYASVIKKPVILIINDVKEDWCIVDRKDKSKIISPRIELVKEFKSKAGSQIVLYSMKQFLFKSNEYVKDIISKNTIEEVGDHLINASFIKEFDSIIGIDSSSNSEDILSILGQPDDTVSGKEKGYHFDQMVYKFNDSYAIIVRFLPETKKILNLHFFSSSKDFLKDKNIYESKINYIGYDKLSLFSVFGKPNKVDDNMFVFKFKGLRIDFFVNGDKCTSFVLKWI